MLPLTITLRRRLLRRALLAVLAGLAAAAAHGAPAAPIDEAQRAPLSGGVHPAVARARELGSPDPALRAERVILVLRGTPQQEAALQRLLADQHTPGRPAYRRWLSPADFARRFGVAPAQMAALQGWLRSKGLHVDEVPAGGRSLAFSGTIARIENAFATRIGRYEIDGVPHLSAAIAPTVPAAFAGFVRGFASLHDVRHRPQFLRGATAPDFTDGSSYYLAPGDFAVIYDLAASYAQGTTGAGGSIAILGRTSVKTADISSFRSQFGLSATLPAIIDNGAAPGYESGDELESDLDLEWSGAVAPAAAIKFVTSASTALTDGIDLSAQYAVSNNVAGIVSLSYSSCESPSDPTASPFYGQLWQQAAAQGMSVFVSSGDSGAAGCAVDTSSTASGGLAVNALCSSPDDTCVGGTEFVADQSAPASYWAASNSATGVSALGYIGEAAWNQSGTVSGGADLFASGGGTSLYYAKPSWQYAPNIPSDGHRDVPDLALAASGAHDAYLVVTSDGYSSSTLVAVGGTSASTPSMAGIAALLTQRQGGRLGNIDPALYALSNLQVNGGAVVFHRITSGDNSVPGQAGFSAAAATPDFSQVSGLGSVDGGQLLSNWSSVSPPPVRVGIAPASALVPASESVGTATLTVAAATAWTATVATGAASWLSVTPASGTGPGVLEFQAKANASAARSGTITVAGLTLAVSQAAAAGNGAAQSSLTPIVLSFLGQTVGTTSSSQQVLLGNAGASTLSVGTASVSGTAAADFAFAGSCLDVGTLAPGDSCFLNVSFTPTAAGSRSASLQVATSASGNAPTVALNGTGTVLAGDVPLPPWTLGLLALTLAAAAQRSTGRPRLRGTAPR
jgi:hypothetical protein